MKRDRGDGTYDIDRDDAKIDACVSADKIRLMDESEHGGEGKAVAVDSRHADVVQLLLSTGANIEAADEVILIIHYCMAVRFVVIIFCRIEISNQNRQANSVCSY